MYCLWNKVWQKQTCHDPIFYSANPWCKLTCLFQEVPVAKMVSHFLPKYNQGYKMFHGLCKWKSFKTICTYFRSKLFYTFLNIFLGTYQQKDSWGSNTLPCPQWEWLVGKHRCLEEVELMNQYLPPIFSIRVSSQWQAKFSKLVSIIEDSQDKRI